MPQPVRVLITGGGGDLAISVLRALRHSGRAVNLIGADANPESVGPYLFDSFYTLPPAAHAEYQDALLHLCSEEAVRVLIPASDAELPVIARMKEELEVRGSKAVVASPQMVDLLRDKAATVEYLEARGIPLPRTRSVAGASSQELEAFAVEAGLPLILKPAISHGSRGLFEVTSVPEAVELARHIEQPILQECIGTADTEYTCGVYVCRSGEVRVLTLRRRLAGGATGIAYLVNDDEIAAYCRQVASVLPMQGSYNIQLRKGRQGPRLFEINPRFSSTTSMRARFGFNDALWSLQEALGESPDRQLPARESFCFRAGEEHYFAEGEMKRPRPLAARVTTP